MFKMDIKKIQLSYFYYFILTGTNFKLNNFFIVLDVIFLLIIPIIYLFLNISKNKRIDQRDGIIIFISLFYFLQVIFNSNSFINEVIYYIPVLLGYFLFFKKNCLNKKEYTKILFLIVSMLTTIFFVKSTHSMYKTGIFNNPVIVGFYSLLGIYITNYSKITENKKALLEFFFIGIILYSNSRGSLAAAIIFILIKRGINLLKIIKTGLLCLIIFFSLNSLNILKIEKLFNKYNSKKLDLMTGRTRIWVESFKYYIEENILGSGIGHYNLITFLKKKVGFANSHNGYVDILVSFGFILGTCIIVFFIFRVIKNHKKSELDLAILLSILVLNLGESVIFFTRVPISLIFWISYGKLERIRLKKKIKFIN